MENDKGWIGGKVICDICDYVWIAVYHIDCDRLECPNCRNMTNYTELDMRIDTGGGITR